MKLGAGPWRSTGCTREDRAKYFALEALQKAKQAAEAARRAIEAVPLKDYLKPFYGHDCPHVTQLRAEKKSIGAEHVKHCRALLDKHVLEDVIAACNVRALRRADIIDFRGRLLASGLGDGQVNRILRVLKTCLKEGLHREELERDPTAGMGNISHRSEKRGVFTQEELHGLFPAAGLGPWANLQAFACFYVAATVGARRSEILALCWRDIDLDKGEIIILCAWKSETELGLPK